jgi:hypothetical protein
MFLKLLRLRPPIALRPFENRLKSLEVSRAPIVKVRLAKAGEPLFVTKE